MTNGVRPERLTQNRVAARAQFIFHQRPERAPGRIHKTGVFEKKQGGVAQCGGRFPSAAIMRSHGFQ